MGERVAEKELEAGLSLLGMMQHARQGAKRAGGKLATPRASKRAKSALLLAAAQQVDPLDGEDDEEEDEEDEEEEGEGDEGARGAVRRNAQLSSLSHELNIEQLREHFNKPIVEVAKEFGICTTFLKKICRRCGIKRWPHRQIRSLTRTIEMLHQAEANATSVPEKVKYATQIAHVEAKKRAVIDNPDANGKLERVKKSVLNRSGSPGSRKHSGDAGSSRTNMESSSAVELTLQPDLLQAVAAAANEVMQAPDEPTAELQVMAATEAEAAAAEALLFSASPRTPVASIDVTMPVVALDCVPLPAMTPTAIAVADSNAEQSTISPIHRKLLSVPKGDNESCARTSSFGALENLDDGKLPTPVSAAAALEATSEAREESNTCSDPIVSSTLTSSVVAAS